MTQQSNCHNDYADHDDDDDGDGGGVCRRAIATQIALSAVPNGGFHPQHFIDIITPLATGLI